DTSLVSIMSGNRLHHFCTIAEIRGHKICTNQQENNLRGIQVCYDLLLPFCPWTNIPIMPGVDDLLASQVTQVFLKFVVKFLILMRIGDEDLECHNVLPRLRNPAFM